MFLKEDLLMKILKNAHILVILIITGMTLTLFFSCGSDTDSASPDSDVAAEAYIETYIPQDQITHDDYMLRENTPDSLPDNLDFGGTQIRILHRSENSMFWHDEIMVEEPIGEIVNDAIYYRNQLVEERLNIEIVSIAIPGDWSNRDNFLRTVRTSIGSGSDDYDLIAGYAFYLPTLAPEGLVYNLHNVPHLDLEANWWSADCAEQMTIGGRLFYITGDLANSLLRGMNVTFFNTQLARDLDIGNLYQIVLDGEFTIDKMGELIRDTYSDLNGDGIRDRGDMYGYGTPTGNQMNAFVAAFDHPIIRKDGDGVPQLVLNTSKMVAMVDKMYDFLYHNENVFVTPESSAGDVFDMFVENRTLFKGGVLNANDRLRAMESDYGILPMPKWDREQPGYYTVSADWYSLFCIPVTCNKIEAVGAAMEALAAESYRRVTPAYYEIALKQKYSRDEETSQMLDIIKEGLRFDFGTVNTANLEGVNAVFRQLMDEGRTDFASLYERNEPRFQIALDRLIEAYQNLP
jgi:hypothetical protein